MHRAQASRDAHSLFPRHHRHTMGAGDCRSAKCYLRCERTYALAVRRRLRRYAKFFGYDVATTQLSALSSENGTS